MSTNSTLLCLHQDPVQWTLEEGCKPKLPERTIKSVDALVTKSNGVHVPWAIVHSVLNVEFAQRLEAKVRAEPPAPLPRPENPGEGLDRSKTNPPQPATDDKDAPLSPGVWTSILDGSIGF